MAVFTTLTDADVETLPEIWDLGAVTACTGIAEGWENTTYALGTERGRFVLTLFESRVEEADLPFFLGLVEHLHGAGLPCPAVIRSRAGGLWARVGGRPAALFTRLDGDWPRDPGPEDCRQAGELIARLHQAGDGFPLTRANAMGPAAWPGLAAALRGRADEMRPGLTAEITAEIEAISKAWPEVLPRGITHGDLFPDNTFFRDGRLVGVIDFTFAGADVLLFDLGVGLNAWGFDQGGRFKKENAAALLAGYQAVRPLEAAERDALPTVARGVALRFLLTRLGSWFDRPPDALVDPKDPMEYWERLRVHRAAADASEYGL